MTCLPTKTPDGLNFEALNAKYRHERDRRLRPDGQKQFIETAGEFRHLYETDPNATVEPRDPISADADVVVLGGGFAGLFAGARMREAGIEDVRIIEMGGDFGGTWYWNRYPGVQCDIESYCYLPLLEEVDYVPKERYSHGPEIYEHCQRIGRHFGLYEKAMFGTIVRTLKWDEAIRRWHVTTDRGDHLRARFVIMGSGPFNHPKLPGIPGIKDFKGHSFHSARWDFDYTGGDSLGGLDKLEDKRVAIIGSGSTGIQIVPHLGLHAKHLYVLQRTPTSIDVRGNRATDPEWAASLKPGWQADRMRDFQAASVGRLLPGMEDPVCDGWTEVTRNFAARLKELGNPKLSAAQTAQLMEEVDFGVMERIRRRVDQVVEDPVTAEALKPYYRFLCKRPGFSDEYLPTFNRTNVTLIDVSGTRGVERITEKGFVANGEEYEVDCIVYASGFEITSEIRRRIGIDVIEGKGGQSLYDHWKDGYRTLHGMTTNGFPNQFFTGFTQGASAPNYTGMLDQQTLHMAYIIKEVLQRGGASIETTQEAQDEWVRLLRETAVPMEDFHRECTPGNFNDEGTRTTGSLIGESYGPGFAAFGAVLADWRDRGDLLGMTLEY
jgi:cyclohexanone monooxygenase